MYILKTFAILTITVLGRKVYAELTDPYLDSYQRPRNLLSQNVKDLARVKTLFGLKKCP